MTTLQVLPLLQHALARAVNAVVILLLRQFVTFHCTSNPVFSYFCSHLPDVPYSPRMLRKGAVKHVCCRFAVVSSLGLDPACMP